MNKAILIGRLVREPDVRYLDREESLCVARYTLAVDRRGKEKEADFIRCVVFGKGAEFAEKYLMKGTKIAVVGRIQTGSYTDREGRKVYTTDVIVEEQGFAESNKVAGEPKPMPEGEDGFMEIPDGVEDEGLPFA